MNRQKICITVVSGIAALLSSISGYALPKSKSKTLVVVYPQSLPAEARVTGEGFFLRATGSGRYYLYEEQQAGTKLVVFDVTDPSKIQVKTVVSLAVTGPYDFDKPVSDKTELIRFRSGRSASLLDLSEAEHPQLRDAPELNNPNAAVISDKSATSDTPETKAMLRPAPHDFEVVDTSSPDKPVAITTVRNVEHQLVNEDTGTTFLLNRNGMTVVRHTDTEQAFATHKQQQSSN